MVDYSKEIEILEDCEFVYEAWYDTEDEYLMVRPVQNESFMNAMQVFEDDMLQKYCGNSWGVRVGDKDFRFGGMDNFNTNIHKIYLYEEE